MLRTSANSPSAVPLFPQELINFPLSVELRDPCAAKTIRDEDVACRVPRDICRTIEQVGLLSRAVSWPLRTGGNIDVLNFSSQQHRNAALRIELHHHGAHLIHHPDVVVRVNTDLRGDHETVSVLADLPDILAIAVELKQT